MARPKKQIVDYFTHDCNCLNKKTLYIIDNKFGNNGYAFWFKLLEILGLTDGHYYNCGDPSALEFLLTKTRLDEISATEILDMLAKLGAIDKELWEIKIIWSQNFVDRLDDVYSKRLIDKPSKPNINSFSGYKLHTHRQTGENINGSDDNSPQDDTGNPHIKLKYSKLNNINSIAKTDDEAIGRELFEEVKEEPPTADPLDQIGVADLKKHFSKHSAEEVKIHNQIKAYFIDNYGKFYSYPKESEGIYRLIKYARQDAPDLPVFDFIKATTEEFNRLKNAGEKLFENQPCLPSIVASKLWPFILEAMKHKNLIRGSPSDETAEVYFKRTMKGVFPGAL